MIRNILRRLVTDCRRWIGTYPKTVEDPSLDDCESFDDDWREAEYELTVLTEPKVVWKGTREGVARLIVPEGAKVVHGGKTTKAVPQAMMDQVTPTRPTGLRRIYKKRAEVVYVDKLFKLSSHGRLVETDQRVHHGKYNGQFTYEEDTYVYPDGFDDRDTQTCSHGIHFFPTLDSAKLW